jgi:tRNA-dihydrouridine synthase B
VSQVWATGLTIGNVQTRGRVMLGPMAGVTDLPYRLICLDLGCGHTYTEMLADMALIYQNRKTLHMSLVEPRERPVTVQLVGSQPETMAEAARIVERLGADIVDINMGCPTPKIVNNGEGSALMRDPAKAEAIVRAVVAVVKAPVTVKIRRGWDEQSDSHVEVAQRIERAGAQAIAVHARYRTQFYSWQADRSVIRAVKRAVGIPVIGNGDITGPEVAARMIAETGCDAVMIARAAQGNPWIFGRTAHYLATGELLPPPAAGERIAMAIRHLAGLVEFHGEHIGVLEMRKHAAWYTRGMPEATKARVLFNAAEAHDEMRRLLEQYGDWVATREGEPPWGHANEE